jgi:hypothetical protein
MSSVNKSLEPFLKGFIKNKKIYTKAIEIVTKQEIKRIFSTVNFPCDLSE